MNYKEKFLKIFNYLTKNGQKVEEWFKDSKLHREDGTAYFFIDKESGGYLKKQWYQNGVLHRTDGPAVEDNAGYSEYWLNGKRHRTDGPAVIKDDADQYYLQWWVNGNELSYQEFQNFLLHEEVQKEIPINNTNQPKKLKL